MNKNSDPKVPFIMEKLPGIMKTTGQDKVPESQDVHGVYCSTDIATCKDLIFAKMGR